MFFFIMPTSHNGIATAWSAVPFGAPRFDSWCGRFYYNNTFKRFLGFCFMIHTDYQKTFVPEILEDKYEFLSRHMFKDRHVVDLGAGPLTLLYHHSHFHGALSYTAVEQNPDYVDKLRRKLKEQLLVKDVIHGSIADFLEQDFAEKNTTLVCSGMERDFLMIGRKLK